MYPIPPSEHLIENRTCKKCSAIFPITDKDMKFYSKVSPIFGGKKCTIPPPTLCPDCRQQRRLAFHNERKLYKGICDGTGKNIISVYSPNSSCSFYSTEYYWSNAWDPMSFGRDINFSEAFFDQYLELFNEIPKQSLVVKECENSEYLNFAYRVKNCYLIFASGRDEMCFYGNRVNVSSYCIDCLLIKNSEQCYECISTFSSFSCKYSQRIKDCRDSIFLDDCIGCKDCYMCVNLSNKQYYIKNRSYSADEYREKIAEYSKKTYQSLRQEYKDFLLSQVRKSQHHINTINALGENLQSAKNIKYTFDGDLLENVFYSGFVDDVTDCMDIDYGYGDTVLQYECMGTGSSSHMGIFSINIWPDVHHIMYCDTCIGSSYCFLSTGLRNKSYCILNKQYTREEYEVLVPRIIEKMLADGEWGEFFPASMSPFGYNETVANEYFPLDKKETIKQHFNWSDYEAPFPKVEKIIPAKKLPDSIESIPDDILNWAIECEVSGKPFRIIKQELEFYRKHSLPIPKRHPDVRHMDRMQMRNPRKLFERKCDCCEKDMITTYAPERLEKVYCEECYRKEVLS